MKPWSSELWNSSKAESKDDPRSRCPKTSTTDKQVDAIRCMVLDDRHLTVQQIAKFIVISSGSVYTVLTEI